MNQISQPLKPASIAEISAVLQVLFDALPFQRGTRADNVAGAYVDALRGFSHESINAGTRKFLRGECEEVSPRFVPTPPELARIVRTTSIGSRPQPEERREPPTQPQSAGERARMRLKMPMWRAAFGSQSRMDALAKANSDGLGAMVVLATAWGVPVPDELLEHADEEGERQWQQAHRRALAEIERNPPPYMRHRK